MNGVLRIVFLIVLYSLLSEQFSYSAQDRWTSVGPFTFSGSVFNEMEFDKADPGTIYISAGTGTYRTRNGGSSWQALDLKGLFLDQNVIAIDPNDGKHVVIGGFPLFESIDSGINWRKLSDLLSYISETQQARIGDIEFHPTNSSILYLINVVGVHKSTDGGKTWVSKNKGLPDFDAPPGLQLEIDPTQPDTLYALFGHENPHKIFKTTDAGENWSPANSGITAQTISEFLLNKSNPQILFAAGLDGIFRSENGGANWTRVQTTSTFRISSDPNNPQKIYAIPHRINQTENFLLQSSDGGSTWSRLFIPTQGGKVFVDPHNSSRLYMIDEQGILFSTTAGSSWIRRNRGILEQEIRQLTAHRLKNGVIFAAGSFLFRSNNSGKTWQTLFPDLFVYQIRIHPKNPNLLFATASPRTTINTKSHVLISRDGGHRWEMIGGPLPGGSPLVLELDPNNPNVLYTGFYGRRGVYKSVDEGKTWALLGLGIPGNSTSHISIPNQSSLLYAVNSSKLYRSENSGVTWQRVTAIRERVFAVAIHPKDSKIAFAAGGQGTIYKTIDGGKTWKLKDRFLGDGNRFIKIDQTNPSLIYAGGGSGLFVSIDTGETWSAFDTEGLNLPTFNLNDFLVKPFDKPLFVAATRESVWTYERNAVAGTPVIRGLSASGVPTDETIVIYGDNFGLTPGAVDLNGVDAQNVLKWSDEVIAVSVPGAAKTGPVSVLTNGERSNTQRLAVLPKSGSVYPTSGANGELVAIVLNQPGCLDGVALFGSAVAHNSVCVPPNIILAVVPPGTGMVDVTYQWTEEPSRIFRAGTYSYTP